MNNVVKVGNISIGEKSPLVLISGPCVIEDYELTCDIAQDKRSQRGGAGSGRNPDPGISVPADRSHFGSCTNGETGKHQKRPVSGAVGYGKRYRESNLNRKRECLCYGTRSHVWVQQSRS